MGFITVIAIMNDGVDQIQAHPQEFADTIVKACNANHSKSYGCGYHVNMIEAIRPHHSNEDVVLCLSGNTLIELSEYSSETERFISQHKDFSRDVIMKVRKVGKELLTKYNLTWKK